MNDKTVGIISFNYTYGGVSHVGIDANGLINQFDSLERDAIKAGNINYQELYSVLRKTIERAVDDKQK